MPRVKATGHDKQAEMRTKPLNVLQWNAEGISKKEDQVIMVRLRTGHSRLGHHKFTKFRI